MVTTQGKDTEEKDASDRHHLTRVPIGASTPALARAIIH